MFPDRGPGVRTGQRRLSRRGMLCSLLRSGRNRRIRVWSLRCRSLVIFLTGLDCGTAQNRGSFVLFRAMQALALALPSRILRPRTRCLGFGWGLGLGRLRQGILPLSTFSVGFVFLMLVKTFLNSGVDVSMFAGRV